MKWSAWLRKNLFVMVVVLIVGFVVLLFLGPISWRAFDREINIDPVTGRSEYHEQIMNPRGRLNATGTDLYR